MSVLRPCSDGYTTVANKRIDNRSLEYVHDALRSCTARQLEYITAARAMCERYAAGVVDELPDTLF